MDPTKIQKKLKALVAPVAMLLAAVYGSMFSYFVGAWFKLGLGDAAPEATPVVFALLGFLGTVVVGLWLLGEDE